ncbi:MAG: hypothetical protein DMD91_21875 [Candidatus Rokuibacteriota bacterium]|nr:MAG: hypothetical protein DMD91_21875 [Candidatus Rokubacteria bacterium]
MGRRLDRKEVEARIGQCANGGDDHGEVFGAGPRERGVGGDRLERGDALSRRERRDHLVRSRPTEQAGRACACRRQHGQAVAPALRHRELLEGVEVVRPGDGLGDGGRRVYRCGIPRERSYHRIDDPVGALAHVVGRHAADRMRHRDHGQVRQPQRRRGRAAERDEGLGAENDGGNAPSLELRRVVDTPRRAGPSVGGSCEDDVGARGDLVVVGGGMRGARLAPDADRACAGSFDQQLGHALEERVGVRLGVVENGDAATRQGRST